MLSLVIKANETFEGFIEIDVEVKSKLALSHLLWLLLLCGILLTCSDVREMKLNASLKVCYQLKSAFLSLILLNLSYRFVVEVVYAVRQELFLLSVEIC
jgi:hypothetical protein